MPGVNSAQTITEVANNGFSMDTYEHLSHLIAITNGTEAKNLFFIQQHIYFPNKN